jgi:hypothetical protein
MKVEHFITSTPHGKEDFNKFTSTHAVDHIDTVTTQEAIWSCVYYYTEGEQSDSERIKLAAHMAIANECSSNYEFNQLRSHRARELWLLATWGVPTVDARDIIELASDGFLTVRSKVIPLD